MVSRIPPSTSPPATETLSVGSKTENKATEQSLSSRSNKSSPCAAFKDGADDLQRPGGRRAVPVLCLKTELMIYEDLEAAEEEEQSLGSV